MSYGNNDPAGTGPGAEPSMEEILASIRRILKDEAGKTPATDDADHAPSEPEDEDILVLDASMIAKPVDLSSATSPPSSPLLARETAEPPLHFTSAPTLTNPVYTPPAAEPDVLLPPDADIPPAITIRPASMSPPPVSPVFGSRSFSDYPVAQAPAPAPAPEAAPKPEPEPEPHSIFYRPAPLPEFTPEPEPMPELVHETAPEPLPEPMPEPESEFAPEPEHVPEPEPEPQPQPQPAYAAYEPPITPPPTIVPPSETQMPEHQDNLQPPASIVSEQVSAAAANSIGAMIRSMTAEKSITVSRTGVTIEDMVREEIRPLLKAWLDTNLAGMVERVVRSEIEKIMERSTS
jgi:cell pole-organizing protein PopZ